MSGAPSPREESVLRLLETAANAGAVCPTNDTLAVELNIETRNQVSSYVSALKNKGLIAVESYRVGKIRGRVITIVSTGKATAPDDRPSPRPLLRVDSDRTLRPLADSAAEVRDPCEWCGTNPRFAAEFGCRRCKDPTARVASAASPLFPRRSMVR